MIPTNEEIYDKAYKESSRVANCSTKQIALNAMYELRKALKKKPSKKEIEMNLFKIVTWDDAQVYREEKWFADEAVLCSSTENKLYYFIPIYRL